MKAFETRETKEKRKKREQILIGFIVAVIMIFGTVGFAFMQGQYNKEEQNGQNEYNGYYFTKIDGMWQTQTNIGNTPLAIKTLYLPKELENITIKNYPLLEDFKGKAVYIIANNLTERQAASEFAPVLNPFVLRMQLACSEKENETEFCIKNDLPIKSCEDATYNTFIIDLEENAKDAAENATNNGKNTIEVNYKNNCLTIKAEGNDLIKASEKTIFKIFGIIN